MSFEQPSRLARVGHAGHCSRCLTGLPASQSEVDASKMAIVFYCLGGLDLLDSINAKTSEAERGLWRDWIWEQYRSLGDYGAGFKPSPFMTPETHSDPNTYSEYDTPHMIMTYAALLSLAMLRDDFTRLDRPGIISFIRSCQREDGSFSALPSGGESDLRSVYCAFVISSMLDDWSGVDLDRAVAYIRLCRSYEGGYGQTPFTEALGGTTYCAIAALALAPPPPSGGAWISPSERQHTIRWLVQNQTSVGGFSGRTGKAADACYCFWCSASLRILGAGDFIDSSALVSFLSKCQFKFGGIAKAPTLHPDPYHSYLSLAALAMYPQGPNADASWKLPRLDALLNATEETAQWARAHIPLRRT